MLPPGVLPPLEAERRPLTVLFCNLVDSTTLAERLDPEDFREVVHAYHQTCAEVIQRFDGYLAQYLGDGVLAYFGYPVAHEDDAQRAVRTGLGMLDALERLNTRLALPPGDRVTVRLGVHTGLVVVGDIGAGTATQPLALGETPHIAARLQSLAAPNTLVISAATYHLIEGYFTCEALGEQPLRGLAQPLRMYRVLRPSGVQSRLEVAAARGLTPLVGRVPEVGLLVERWARVKAGMGQVVVLVGEAGIGKSRLVQVLKDHVAGEAHTCLECRGSPDYQHTAWYPVTELFQRWLQWRPGEAPGAALEQLEALLAQAHLPLDETVPLVAALLALPLPAERYPPRPLPPEQQRQHTLDTLLALVGALAEQQPVLLIVEDLHWVDPSTLELLGAPDRPGTDHTSLHRAHVSPYVSAPLGLPHAPHAHHPQSLNPAASRGDGRGRMLRGTAPARGGAGADCREDRWHPPVCRRGDQSGAGGGASTPTSRTKTRRPGRCRRWPFPPHCTRRCWLGSIGWGAPKGWRNWGPHSGASFPMPCCGLWRPWRTRRCSAIWPR